MENIITTEAHLPLKKRTLELTPPSSLDNHNLVIDENLSPSKSPSPCKTSELPIPDDSIASFLPWPLLLQLAAMHKQSQLPHNSCQDLNVPSLSNLDSYSPTSIILGNSLKINQSEHSESMGSQDLINCEECGKRFKPSSLHIHKRRFHHLLHEPVKCCGQDFPTRWHLSQHKKSGDHLPTLWKSGSLKQANGSITTN